MASKKSQKTVKPKIRDLAAPEAAAAKGGSVAGSIEVPVWRKFAPGTTVDANGY